MRKRLRRAERKKMSNVAQMQLISLTKSQIVCKTKKI